MTFTYDVILTPTKDAPAVYQLVAEQLGYPWNAVLQYSVFLRDQQGNIFGLLGLVNPPLEPPKG
jgi:hypothetical protein